MFSGLLNSEKLYLEFKAHPNFQFGEIKKKKVCLKLKVIWYFLSMEKWN